MNRLPFLFMYFLIGCSPKVQPISEIQEKIHETKESSPFIEIEEVNPIAFHDGIRYIESELGKEFWLGSTDFKVYGNAHVLIPEDSIRLNLFKHPKDSLVFKYLSTFQPPKRGFYKEDLYLLAQQLGLPVPRLEEDIYQIPPLTYGHSSLLYISINRRSYGYLLLVTITGGPAPEGMIVNQVWKVQFHADWVDRYFN